MEEHTNEYNLEVHVYLSNEGKVVLKFYKLLEEVKEHFTHWWQNAIAAEKFLSTNLCE